MSDDFEERLIMHIGRDARDLLERGKRILECEFDESVLTKALTLLAVYLDAKDEGATIQKVSKDAGNAWGVVVPPGDGSVTRQTREEIAEREGYELRDDGSIGVSNCDHDWVLTHDTSKERCCLCGRERFTRWDERG